MVREKKLTFASAKIHQHSLSNHVRQLLDAITKHLGQLMLKGKGLFWLSVPEIPAQYLVAPLLEASGRMEHHRDSMSLNNVLTSGAKTQGGRKGLVSAVPSRSWPTVLGTSQQTPPPD